MKEKEYYQNPVAIWIRIEDGRDMVSHKGCDRNGKCVRTSTLFLLSSIPKTKLKRRMSIKLQTYTPSGLQTHQNKQEKQQDITKNILMSLSKPKCTGVTDLRGERSEDSGIIYTGSDISKQTYFT